MQYLIRKKIFERAWNDALNPKISKEVYVFSGILADENRYSPLLVRILHKIESVAFLPRR